MGAGMRQAATAGMLALVLAGAHAQVTGIYSCVDAKGKRWTSDRPIPECSEREQKVYNPSGTLRQVVPPPPTAKEREAQEAQERRLAEERQRQAEEKRVERALLSRYPNRAAHDADRAKALAQVQESIDLAQRGIAEQQKQRDKLMLEAEFYKDKSKWPAKLKRAFDENDQQVAAQKRYIANQEEEKKRANARFDDELAKLKNLWTPPVATKQ